MSLIKVELEMKTAHLVHIFPPKFNFPCPGISNEVVPIHSGQRFVQVAALDPWPLATHTESETDTPLLVRI